MCSSYEIMLKSNMLLKADTIKYRLLYLVRFS